MPLVPFDAMMRRARANHYAVGYFESWNLESLLAVADAAEKMRSPVLLGFSGIHLPHPQRRTAEHLQDYFALAQSVASRLTVPCCLVFNESPNLTWVHQAINLGFGLVMFSPESPIINYESLVISLQTIVSLAHSHSLAFEAELAPLAGVAGELETAPSDLHLTDPDTARTFVADTGIDALAVNVGQVHLHGRTRVRLDLDRLRALQDAVDIPLVLHGATSVHSDDLRAAIEIGVSKINVGSALKRIYFDSLKTACNEIGTQYNPYDVLGSGLDPDVLTTARLALQSHVEQWIQLFGSADQLT